MTYASLEKRREAIRRHYATHKDSYNPSRKFAYQAKHVAREQVQAESMTRWVSPEDMRMICSLVVAGAGIGTGNMRLIEEFCFAGFPGSKEAGVFLGASPFRLPRYFGPKRQEAAGSEWAHKEFIYRLAHMTEKAKRSAAVELLILNLTLRMIQNYGH